MEWKARALDLSSRFVADAEMSLLPDDLAVLMVGVAARQAASATALAQAGCARPAEEPGLFAPADGAFNGAVAMLLADWSGE